MAKEHNDYFQWCSSEAIAVGGAGGCGSVWAWVCGACACPVHFRGTRGLRHGSSTGIFHNVSSVAAQWQ